ncbi:MAG: glycoprotease, partial [Oscillospiraceae bacterium]
KTVLLNKKQFLNVPMGEKGLRQQDAVFNHIKNLTTLFELVDNEFNFDCIQAIGVSVKPTKDEGSYMPCFLVGQMVATAVAAALKVPLVKTSHQDGHLNSALFYLKQDDYYNKRVIMFHVSGGTTDMLLVENAQIIKTLGSSKDLFAGQAIDRLGVKLGYGFPAGEQVSRLSQNCKEAISKPKVSVKNMDCNLSGLENQCDKLLNDHADVGYVAKYCLSFIAYTLIEMAKNARNEYGDLPIIFAGGVMSSDTIKEIVALNMQDVHFVLPIFSQDNGIGDAALEARKVLYG